RKPPANPVVWSLPPIRSGSTSVTSRPAWSRARAATSPVIPPPTTAAVATSGAFRRGGEHPVGQRRERRRVVVQDAGAGEGEPEGLGLVPGLDVEVVADLEVIAREPLRADEHAVGPPGLGQVLEHAEDVRAPPGLRGAPGGLPA